MEDQELREIDGRLARAILNCRVILDVGPDGRAKEIWPALMDARQIMAEVVRLRALHEPTSKVIADAGEREDTV